MKEGIDGRVMIDDRVIDDRGSMIVVYRHTALKEDTETGQRQRKTPSQEA